ncbi:MAG: amino acid permease [Bacteroidota bacterium]
MPNPQLNKTIGLSSAVAIVVGSVIGSGIFMKPATMAAQLGSPIMLIAVWVVAGIISIFGGMIYAELGSMFPETGGQYIYLKKMYGNFWAFLYGWSGFAVINTAAVASIAYVFAQYTEYFIHLPKFSAAIEQSVKWHIPMIGDIFPLQNAGVKSLAIITIMTLSAINYISVRWGNGIQFIATVLKTVAILFLVFGIFITGHGNVSNFTTPSSHTHLTGWAMVAAFVAATSGAFASYDGWNNITMMAGELKNPTRNLTKSLFIGIGICMAVYVLINLAYLYALPIDTMAASPLVASDAAEKMMGIFGGGFIALLIAVSCFGATNVNTLACARITFAMAQNKSFFAWAGKVHPRFKSPGNAVLLHGIWSSLFVITGSFDILTDMFIFMAWFFYGLTVVGFFILRKKMPEAERPYKVWGYPIIPILFVGFTVFYIGTTLYNDISNYAAGRAPVINSVLGLLLTALGIPLYYYFKRK